MLEVRLGGKGKDKLRFEIKNTYKTFKTKYMLFL